MYNIRNMKIKSGKEYLDLAPRRRLNTNVREDLLSNFKKLSTKIKTPKSKMLDVMIYLLLEDKEIWDKFMKTLKDY